MERDELEPEGIPSADFSTLLKHLRDEKFREAGECAASRALSPIAADFLPGGTWDDAPSTVRGFALNECIAAAIAGMPACLSQHLLARYYVARQPEKEVQELVARRGGTFDRHKNEAREALREVLKGQLADASRGRPRSGSHAPASLCRHVYGIKQQAASLRGALEASRPDEPYIVVVTNAGGIGKTELVRYVAEEMEKKGAISGVLWVRGRPYEFDFAASLGVPQLAVSRTASARWVIEELMAQLGYRTGETAAFKSHVRAYPHLIVVDNAENLDSPRAVVDELKEYLGRSRVIVICREPGLVQAPFVRCFRVEGLLESETANLLRGESSFAMGHGVYTSLNSATDKDLREIYLATGGAPLALHLVVGQSTYLSVDRIIANLQSANGPSQSLYEFVFRRDWEELAQHVLGTVARDLLGCVCNSEAGAPRSHLREVIVKAGTTEADSVLDGALALLTQLSLIHPVLSPALGEFKYEAHPLTRNFIRSGLGEQWNERLKALRRQQGDVRLDALRATQAQHFDAPQTQAGY